MNLKIPRLPFYEDKICSLLILLSFLVPLAFDWYLYEKFEIIKISFWATCLGFLIIFSLKKGFNYPQNKFLWTLLTFYLIFGLLSSLFSVGRLNSLLGFYPRFTSGLLFYSLWLCTLLIFIGALTKEKFVFIGKVIFFDSLVIALFGIMQSFGIGYYSGIEQPFISRAPSLLGNPNFSSMFVAVSIFLIVPLFIEAKSFKAKVYYSLSGFVMLMALISFSSRGALLGLVCGLGFLVLMIFWFTKRKYVILSLFLSLFCAGSVLYLVQIVRPGGLTEIFNFSNFNVESRFFAWNTALNAIIKNPILGVGPGNLQVYFERYRPNTFAAQGGVFDDAHNLFLQMAATTGIFFTLSFVGLLIYGFWLGYKSLKNDPSDWMSVSLMIMLIVWVIISFFTPVSSANFFILAIILAGLMYRRLDFKIIRAKSFYRGGLNFAAAAFIVLGSALLVSETLFFAGLTAYQGFNFEKSHKFINTAKLFNPTNQLYFLYDTANQIMLDPQPEFIKKEITRVVNLQPQSARSYVMAANLSYLMYDRSKNTEFLKDAINFMNESLLMDKYTSSRYGHTAYYLATDNQLKTARDYAKTGLTLNPQHLPTWLLLARIYQLENKPVQMRYALNEAFKLKPDDLYLRRLNSQAKSSDDLDQFQIPAIINIYQIES